MVLGIAGVLVVRMEFQCPSIAWISHSSQISEKFLVEILLNDSQFVCLCRYGRLSSLSVDVETFMRLRLNKRIDTCSHISLQTGSRSVSVHLRNGSVPVQADLRLVRDDHSYEQEGAPARAGVGHSQEGCWQDFLRVPLAGEEDIHDIITEDVQPQSKKKDGEEW